MRKMSGGARVTKMAASASVGMNCALPSKTLGTAIRHLVITPIDSLGASFEARPCGQSGRNWRNTMKLIERHGTVEIWEVKESYGSDFYVYGVLRSPIVRPSLDAARAAAAK